MIDLNKYLKNKIHNCIFICPVCKEGFDIKEELPKVVLTLTQVPSRPTPEQPMGGVTIGTIPQPICNKCFGNLHLLEEDIAIATTMPKTKGAADLLKAVEGFKKK